MNECIAASVSYNGKHYPEVCFHEEGKIPFGNIRCIPSNGPEETVCITLDLPGNNVYSLQLSGVRIRPRKLTKEEETEFEDQELYEPLDWEYSENEIEFDESCIQSDDDVFEIARNTETQTSFHSSSPNPNDINDSMKESLWVMCDRCGKWRRLASTSDSKILPKQWYCENGWVGVSPNILNYSNCEIEEEEQDVEEIEVASQSLNLNQNQKNFPIIHKGQIINKRESDSEHEESILAITNPSSMLMKTNFSRENEVTTNINPNPNTTNTTNTSENYNIPPVHDKLFHSSVSDLVQDAGHVGSYSQIHTMMSPQHQHLPRFSSQIQHPYQSHPNYGVGVGPYPLHPSTKTFVGSQQPSFSVPNIYVTLPSHKVSTATALSNYQHTPSHATPSHASTVNAIHIPRILIPTMKRPENSGN